MTAVRNGEVKVQLLRRQIYYFSSESINNHPLKLTGLDGSMMKSLTSIPIFIFLRCKLEIIAIGPNILITLPFFVG